MRGHTYLDKLRKTVIVAGDVASTTAAGKWETEDDKAKSDIILSIGPSELKQIKSCTTSNEVWKKLESVYQSTGPARKATLLKRLMLHRMSETDDVRDHLREFFDCVDKLGEMEVNVNPDLLAIMLLYSLPRTFENFRVAIESRDELPAPETLRVKIIEETDARKGDGRGTCVDAMVAKKQWNKPRKCARDAKDEKFRYKCHCCRKVGHKAAECTENTKKNEKAHVANDVSLYTCVEKRCDANAFEANAVKRSGWCLDSGCTAHLCKNTDDFVRLYDSAASGKLSLASNGASAQIEARGIVNVRAITDQESVNVSLNNTLYVPDLRTNLLSVAKITDNGYEVTFGKNSAEIIDRNGSVVIIADRRDGLYYLREEVTSRESGAGESAFTTLQTWHRRTGHLNIEDLLECSRKGIVKGVNVKRPKDKFDCKICIQGKMTRVPFPERSERSTELLNIIHSDVCGPSRTEETDILLRSSMTIPDGAKSVCLRRKAKF